MQPIHVYVTSCVPGILLIAVSLVRLIADSSRLLLIFETRTEEHFVSFECSLWENMLFLDNRLTGYFSFKSTFSLILMPNVSACMTAMALIALSASGNVNPCEILAVCFLYLRKGMKTRRTVRNIRNERGDEKINRFPST